MRSNASWMDRLLSRQVWVSSCAVCRALALRSFIHCAPAAALAAARDIRQACRALPEPLEVSIGLDCGRFLYVPHSDCFGDPVNVAYKLAEDIAGHGEILASDRVFTAAGQDAAAAWQECELSGLRLSYAALAAD